MDNKMENPRVVQENWSQIKRAIHARYADLTESDLEETHGDLNDLEDLMAEKLGESRDEARSHLQEFLKPYQEAGASQGQNSRRRDVPEQPPMISDGIKGDVQNLKDDLNAQHPLDGAASGIQSGSAGSNMGSVADSSLRPAKANGSDKKPLDRQSGDLDPLKPIDSSVHSGQNFAGQGDQTRPSPPRFERAGKNADAADDMLDPNVGQEPGEVRIATPSKTNY